ncbi:MAG TPA: PD-(D/E)XK nuclease family protein [Acidimicrobiales bacterium]|nr:PD-(D/E)XK nuclease family protein [Acidimicrobiales bacterium]
MLAALLGDPSRLGQPVGGEVLDEARAILDHAAGSGAGSWSADEPLRLAKASVRGLLECPRRSLADPDLLDSGDLTNIVLGQIVDAGAKLATLGPAVPPTVAAACEYLVAIGDERVADHLLDVGAEAAEALLADAAARLDPLVAGWPATIDGQWWPRVEEPVRLRLAGGAVVVSGKLDILLGGPPTGLPGLVVELKGGQWHDSVRQDGHLYALLVGLRDGVAPAAVLSIAAADGATQLEPIRPEVVLHAAERVATAIETAAAIAAGEPARACPGSYCAFCPLRPGCPEGTAAHEAAA